MSDTTCYPSGVDSSVGAGLLSSRQRGAICMDDDQKTRDVRTVGESVFVLRSANDGDIREKLNNLSDVASLFTVCLKSVFLSSRVYLLNYVC